MPQPTSFEDDPHVWLWRAGWGSLLSGIERPQLFIPSDVAGCAPVWTDGRGRRQPKKCFVMMISIMVSNSYWHSKSSPGGLATCFVFLVVRFW